MGLLLFLISQTLKAVFHFTCIFYAMVKAFLRVQLKTGLSNANDKFFTVALADDKYMGVFGKELLNDTCITKDSQYIFGDIKDTISWVLGMNELHNTLTGFGRFWVKVLDFIDPGHCQKTIGVPVTRTMSKRQRIIIWICIALVIGLVIWLVI